VVISLIFLFYCISLPSYPQHTHTQTHTYTRMSKVAVCCWLLCLNLFSFLAFMEISSFLFRGETVMSPLTHRQHSKSFKLFRNTDSLAHFFMTHATHLCSCWLNIDFLYSLNREEISGPFEVWTPLLVSSVLGFRQWIQDYIEENK
jgi:hypothetical protein